MRRPLLFVGALCSIVFTISSMFIHRPGYHVYVYNTLPTFAWVAFSGALLCGVLCLYLGVQNQSRRTVIQSSVLLGGAFTMFWFYPLAIGLRFWSPARGDLLMHFGLSKVVLDTGHLPAIDTYPLPHLLLAQLVELTGLRIGVFGPLLSYVYYGLLISGLVFLARRYGSTTIAGYVLVASTPLIFNKYAHAFMPWVLTFSLIPSIFLLHHVWMHRRLSRWSAFLAAAVIFTFIVFGHPMTGGIALMVIVAMEVIRRTAEWWTREKTVEKAPVSFVLLAGVLYPAWYLSRPSFEAKIQMIVLALIGKLGNAAASANAAQSSGLSPLGIAEFIIGKWGTLLLYGGVAGLICLVSVYRILRRRASQREMLVTGLFAFGGGVSIVLFAGNFIASNPYRVSQITIPMMFFVIGGALFLLSKQDRYRDRLARGSLVVVVLMAVVWAPFTIYDEDNHITESEFEGSEFLLLNRDVQHHVESIKMSNLVAQYLRGSHNIAHYENWAFAIAKPEYQLPKRLGYQENATFEQSVGNQTYAITKTRDYYWWRGSSESRLDKLRYYTRDDTHRLARDATSNRLYSNGNFTVWKT